MVSVTKRYPLPEFGQGRKVGKGCLKGVASERGCMPWDLGAPSVVCSAGLSQPRGPRGVLLPQSSVSSPNPPPAKASTAGTADKRASALGPLPAVSLLWVSGLSISLPDSASLSTSSVPYLSTAHPVQCHSPQCARDANVLPVLTLQEGECVTLPSLEKHRLGCFPGWQGQGDVCSPVFLLEPQQSLVR